MKKILTSVFILLSVFVNAQLVAEWNFNSRPNDFNLTTGSAIPNIGTGVIATIGLVSNLYEDANGSSDAAQSDNTGYSTSSYPNAGQGNKSAGIELAVNTTNYSNIILKFNIQCAPNAANRYIVQYCTDGITYIDFSNIHIAPNNASFFIRDNIIDFSTVAGINNNPTVKFRIVSSFDYNQNSYVSVNDSTNGYSTAGKVNFDMVSVTAFGALPVTLSSFTGAYINKNSVLNWTVGTEINILKYVVERSTDGRIFTEMGFVKATGSVEYFYTDTISKAAINFYRLSIIGANEKKYSVVVKILSDAFKSKLNVYPSPASNFLNAEFTSENKAIANVQMTDVSGRIIMQKAIPVQQGYNNLNFDINTFKKGLYILKIIVFSNTFSSTFNKL